jgi:hypothetical protein
MRVIRCIETRLDIEEIADVFTADYEALIMGRLDKFKGVCYKNCMILDIVRIISRGQIMCKAKVTSGTFYVDVLFEINALVLVPGETIHGCKIMRIDDRGLISATAPYMAIQVKKNNMLKVGDEMPFIVERVRYNLFDNQIAVLARPFIPAPFKPQYYMVDATANDAAIDMTQAMANIARIKDELATVDKDVYAFFKAMLTPRPGPKPAGFSKTQLGDLGAVETGALIAVLDKGPDDTTLWLGAPADNAMLVPKSELIHMLVLQHERAFDALLGFCHQYPDLAAVKSKKHIWEAYVKAKAAM